MGSRELFRDKKLESAKINDCKLQIDNVFTHKKISQVGEYQIASKNTCNSTISDYSVVTAMNSSDLIKHKIPISDYSDVTDINSFDLIKQTIPINVNTIDLGQKDPYSQFRFPKIDPPLTKAGQLEVSKLDSLEYLVNLMAGKLRPDLKNVWDQLAGRDTSLKEISKSGMQLTNYDLKQECAKFKKAGEKQKYINNLNKLSAFDSQVNQVNFIRPTSGPLSEILIKCGDKNQRFHNCLYKIYYNDKDKFSILLNEIKQYMMHKTSRKIVNRFIKLISNEHPKLYKVSYFMRYITRTVYHGKKSFQHYKSTKYVHGRKLLRVSTSIFNM